MKFTVNLQKIFNNVGFLQFSVRREIIESIEVKVNVNNFEINNFGQIKLKQKFLFHEYRQPRLESNQ